RCADRRRAVPRSHAARVGVDAGGELMDRERGSALVMMMAVVGLGGLLVLGLGRVAAAAGLRARADTAAEAAALSAAAGARAREGARSRAGGVRPRRSPTPARRHGRTARACNGVTVKEARRRCSWWCTRRWHCTSPARSPARRVPKWIRARGSTIHEPQQRD